LSVRVGIDTGGTFSDFVALDEASGRLTLTKVASTPRAPSLAIEHGIGRLAGADDADQVVVGTTVATNAVLQRQGPRVVLVTNEGFRDVVFIGRMDKEQLYDLHWQKPKPLVERRDVLEVACRVDHTGAVLEPLAAEAIAGLERALAERDGNVVVAVSLLFSYLRPDDEVRVREVVERALPGVPVSVSHRVSPVWREYERTSTTVADAFVKPIVADYVDAVDGALAGRTRARGFRLLGSNGGFLDAARTRAQPAQLLLSGLAGGVIGGTVYARAAGFEDVFTLDMGGTSCDIGLVEGGRQAYASEFALAFGIPITIPCVAVQTIGAGGGSIAWVDAGGLLRVGPQSAGAEPGPAAYAAGGVEPTLTDANLVLGRLAPDAFLGGELPLDEGLARAAYGGLGVRLQLGTEEAAAAAVRIADENMANAVRLIAVERGVDPRDYALIAFGGAGPLHARAVAERLGITTLLVPPHPGVCSAFGAAVALARIDRTRSYYTRSDAADVSALAAAERELTADTVAELRATVDVDDPVVERSADMRYVGQNYELEVPIVGDLAAEGLEPLLARFAARHREAYGFELPGELVEITLLRAIAWRDEPPPALVHLPERAVPPRTRPVHLGGAGPEPCAVYERTSLAPGATLSGPAIIEELDSTTLVMPGDRLHVHESGVLCIRLEGQG
jgi:N-methylhydantoinase A